MNLHRRLPVTDEPAAADLSELDGRINDYNADRTGIRDARYLSIMLRSDEGELYAGLHGHSWGGCCEIKLLWVAEDRRGEGLGTRLLQSAEDEAIRRGCHLILLATRSFQAPGFYERHGFSPVATVHGYPAGHSEIFMVKYPPA
ncbi:GNAT family N-acetyltransferase [Sphingomonas oligophenolica]|uniref:GNAT family N-acetyltransferase n=1 Tax=Sphingomonas oligophenolica TaxID=301154 RepID=A0ABU9Y749_9SPHN